MALDIQPGWAIIGEEDDPMVRTGRPITLPGLWGPLARECGGVVATAKLLGIPERSFRNYACNTRSMDAIVAIKAEILGASKYACVFTDPRNESIHVASVAEGWVQWPAIRDGFWKRKAWVGDPATLEPGSLAECRRHGWPL